MSSRIIIGLASLLTLGSVASAKTPEPHIDSTQTEVDTIFNINTTRSFSQGQLVKETELYLDFATAKVTKFAYDSLGRLEEKTEIEGVNTHVTHFSYDPQTGKLLSEETTNYDKGNPTYTSTYIIRYDSLGQLLNTESTFQSDVLRSRDGTIFDTPSTIDYRIFSRDAIREYDSKFIGDSLVTKWIWRGDSTVTYFEKGIKVKKETFSLGKKLKYTDFFYYDANGAAVEGCREYANGRVAAIDSTGDPLRKFVEKTIDRRPKDAGYKGTSHK